MRWARIFRVGLLLLAAGCGSKATAPVAPPSTVASKWDKTETNGPTNWMGVWVRSDSTMFAVGPGTIARYGPPPYGDKHWTFTGSSIPSFNTVCGGPANDVYAFGIGGTKVSYIAANQNWDGPISSGTVYDLWGAWWYYAVGSEGTILGPTGVMTSGTTVRLLGVWGAAWDSVFAVGVGGKILHYDGSSWSPMTSGTAADLLGVWGSSGNDVFAVGLGGTILHYDGTNWSPMTSGTSADLRSVWGSSGSDVFGVGSRGTILRYDGSSWNPMESGTTVTLRGVSGSSANYVYVVGDGTILRYDGS